MPAEVRPHDFASEVIQHAATQLAVFVRPAELSDAEHLIHLNQAFRYEMAQWEANLSDDDGEGEGYPVLDYDDVEFILTKEDPVNLIVLGRRLENEERIIGYSYSYTEPWESAVSAPARRTRTGATPRKQAAGARTKSDTPESLYLAELFIAEQERGLGLGELLLTGTLHARPCSGLSSHLFVSSKNVSAVKCYLKFGYDRGTRPSGDAAHDLVMEMRNCEEGVMRSVERLSQQLIMGTIGARRRRKPAMLEKKESSSSGDSRSASATSSSSTVAMSRASSSTLRTSPPPHAVKPLATKVLHCADPEENGPQRRSTRNADRDSFELGSAPIQGRQRKPLRMVVDKSVVCAKRASKPNVLSTSAHAQKPDKGASKAAVTRKMKRPKFLLTGMRTSAVANAKSVISRLAAEVIDSDVYDPAATHVIAPRSLRTEKFLCALAAGKHLLKAGYIQDCDSAGRLLPEEGYEWEASSRLGTQHLFDTDHAVSSRLRSSATQNPRACSGSPNSKSKGFSCTGNPASTTTGCFNGITATLIISEEKKDCFRRVLEAGNATLSNKSFGKTVDPASVTHAFVSRDLFDSDSEVWSEQARRAALKQLETLQDNSVPCFFDNLIVDFLIGLDPKPHDYMVDNVCTKDTRPVKHDKRKAAAPVGMEMHAKKTRMMTLLQPSH
eukprot:Tamp_04899.p1 GENE.Tamp_04899~~Tamp_04899.p1  ORF type:complete len:669 (-),score=157.22 Tamp_04899:829-2835(-)